MVFELIIAAYFVEASRTYYKYSKEINRRSAVGAHFKQFLRSSSTWEELFAKVEDHQLNNPVLYTPIPQTWLGNWYERESNKGVNGNG